MREDQQSSSNERQKATQEDLLMTNDNTFRGFLGSMASLPDDNIDYNS